MSDDKQRQQSNPLAPEGIAARIKVARQKPGYDLSVEALSRLSKKRDGQGQGITATTLTGAGKRN